MPNYKRQLGFNVIELMVTLFVGAIVLSVGVPAFTGFAANNRIATASNDIATTLHLARTEAIKRRAAVSVCASADWDTNNPSCTGNDFANGWIVFVDALAPAVPDLNHNGAADVLLAHGPLNDNVTLTLADAGNPIANGGFVSFGANGVPVANLGGNRGAFNFQLCDDRGNEDVGGGIAAGRWIQLAPTGRPQIYRDVAHMQSGANPTNGC